MKRFFNSQSFLIVLLAATIAGSLVYFLNTQQRKLNVGLMVQSARMQAELLTNVRGFYLKEIVQRVAGSDVTVTHDFRNMEKAIPIPATMTLELSEYLNARSSDITTALVSEYPFPWRQSRQLTQFENRILEEPRLLASGEYWELSPGPVQVLSYATPIFMDQGCVDCHNSHPDSPKTDWELGDIRGLQIVQIPVSSMVLNLDFESALVTGLIVLITFTATLALLFLNHRAFRARVLLERRNRELALAREKADEASRAKTDFLANMSHEIRTPLNGVIGMMQTLEPSQFDEQTRETLSLMGRSARSLRTIVNNILDISKIEARKAEVRATEFNIINLINDLADRYAVSFSGEKTKLVIDIDPDLPSWIIGDGDKVEQILSNLMSNARKFTDRGEVCLAAKFHRSRQMDSTNTLWIEFKVSDTGMGISPEQVERLFTPFFQADTTLTRNHEGTGLGLAIVRELSVLMGGTVDVDSHPGQGSAFTVTLPFTLANRPLLPRVDRADTTPRVVVLSHDRRDLHLINEVLRALGLSAASFAKADQARVFLADRCQSLGHLIIAQDFEGDSQKLLQWFRSSRPDLASAGVTTVGTTGADLSKPLGRSAINERLVSVGIVDATAGKGSEKTIAPPSEVALPRLSILVVDDNVINRRVLGRLLSQMGMDIDTAADAASAIQRVEAGGIDLVMMDVQMPEMDGYEATAQLRARGYHDLEIIACTAHAFEADREKALDKGMNGHIAKPVERTALRELLLAYVEKRNLRAGG